MILAMLGGSSRKRVVVTGGARDGRPGTTALLSRGGTGLTAPVEAVALQVREC